MRERENVVRQARRSPDAPHRGPATTSEPDELPSPEQVNAAIAAFAMLADPTRLRLLWLLSRGERDVGTLAELAGTTPSSASQHLTKLRLAGLVTVRTDGRHRLYAARDTHLRRLITEALHHADHQVAGHPDHP